MNVLSNDSPGTDAKLDPASVELLGAEVRGLSGYAKKVTVAGQGTYTVQPTGIVVFDPLPAFHGQARPITYRVADSNGTFGTSTLTMTVTPIWPVAVDDSAITPFNQPITVDVLANDKAGDPSAPLVAASLVLKTKDGFGKTYTQAGEGTYAVTAAGAIAFTPVKDFQGLTTPATYRIADDNGTMVEGLLFLTVGKGPEAVADVATTKQNVTLAVEPLDNDKAGTGAELEKSSVEVYSVNTRSWVRIAALTGQGIVTVSESTGRVVVDPVPAFRGVLSIAYRVKDTSGNLATSTLDGDGQCGVSGRSGRRGGDAVRHGADGAGACERQAGRSVGAAGCGAAARPGVRGCGAGAGGRRVRGCSRPSPLGESGSLRGQASSVRRFRSGIR